MAHRPLLTEEQQKELDMIRSMSYEEDIEWMKQLPPICEGKKVEDYIEYIDDMSLEEFVRTHELIDITDRIKRYATDIE